MSDHQLDRTAQPEILSAVPASDATPGPAPMLADAPTSLSAAAAPELVDAPTAVGDTAADLAPEAPTPCTQAQLRRFIKSRPYVPLHELRRRFGLNGADDDVSGVEVDGQRIFIGLPERETGLLGELLRQGDVGYELLLDPTSPLVIGVFPMRPVQRP